MTAQLLSGKNLAAKLTLELAHKIRDQVVLGHRPPQLSVILMGNNPASQLYVAHKRKTCEEIGIISTLHELSENCTEQELLDLIDQLNHDKNTDGILVQLPLPKHITKEKVFEKINPQKDVDGFHPYNLGKLAQGHPTLRPCTPYGIIKLLKYYDIKLEGLHAVIVGASLIVGRPLALELLSTRSTVTLCHSRTKNLEKHIREADLLISATGQKNVIQADWIKTDSVIIDVGIHREDNVISGDLDFEAASKIASFITPVPGGVGPMTIAVLMENTVRAYLHALSHSL